MKILGLDAIEKVSNTKAVYRRNIHFIKDDTDYYITENWTAGGIAEGINSVVKSNEINVLKQITDSLTVK